MFFIIDIIPILKCLKTFKGCCDTCHINGDIQLLKSYQCLRLFFIPTFKWSVKYYLKPSCGVPIKISEDTAIELLHGHLNINTLHLENAILKTNVCIHCGQTLNDEFEYCPYCGNKKQSL